LEEKRMTQDVDHTEMRKTARIAGILYLIIIVGAGFSQGAVRGTLVVPGDAAATAANIMGSQGLYRLGFVGDLVAFLSDAAVAMLLYVVLRPVSKTISLLAAAFRLLAHPAVAGINLLNHMAPLVLLGGGGYLNAFDTAQLQSLSLFFLEAHRYGYLIAGAFFGLSLLFLGWLLYRAEYFPKVLGILLAAAALGYLIESFGNFLITGNEEILGWIVGLPAAVGEISFTVWLLVKGVRSPKNE
jgi:hypothetical protein